MAKVQDGYTLYGRRWIVLIAFICCNVVQIYVWTTFSSVVTDAWKFYGFSDAASGEFAMSAVTLVFMIGMITLSVPASAVFAKLGWYKTVSTAAIVVMLFTLLRGFVGDTYVGMMVCACGVSAMQPFMINAFGMIAANWFPPSERGIANGLGMVSTYIGVAMVQFGVLWLMSTFGMDIPHVLKVLGFAAIPLSLFIVFAGKEKPPTPPCDEELVERIDWKSGMKSLIRNKQFILALLIFWFMQGIYFVFSTLIEPILQYLNNDSLDSMFIGTLGTIMTVFATAATLILPIMADKSKTKKRLPMVRVCEIGALVGLVLFFAGHGIGMLIVAAAFMGVFLMGITPVLLVLGYETAYPVSEGITESLMQLGANGFGMILLLFINAVFRGQHGGTMLFLSAAMAVAVVMAFFIRERSAKERLLEK